LADSPQQLVEDLIQSTDTARSMAIARELVECGDEVLAARLFQLLTTHESAASAAGAFLLAEWSNQGHVSAKHVPEIVKGLAHPSPEVRQWSAVILRGIRAHARDAVKPLLGTLDDPDIGVRQAAVDALGQIAGGDEEVLLRLLDGLSDGEPVRNAVVRVLKSLDKVQEPVLAKLTGLIRGPDSGRRAGAAAGAGALLRIRAEFVAMLVECLSDPCAEVRFEAARSLSEIPSPSRAAALGLGKALRDPVASVRKEAARALDVFGDAAAPAVPYLLAVLKDSDPTVRFHAVEALEKLAPRQAAMLPAVVVALGNRLIDTDVAVQTRALAAFSRLAPHAFPLNPHLLAAVRSPDAEIRLAAIEALDQIRNEGLQVRDTLRRALRDPDGGVRVAAALALAKRKESGAEIVSALVAALREPCARVQIAAIQALRTLGRDAMGATKALEAKRVDSNPDIRQLAELAINTIAGRSLVGRDA